MKHNLAIAIARDIQTQLAPACVQIEIAGGLRRGKPDPHDIELVAQPRLVPVENLFGEHIEDHSLLDERLAELLDAGNGALWEGDRLIETPTEASFFQVLGLPMPAPSDRSPSWGQFTEVAQ